MPSLTHASPMQQAPRTRVHDAPASWDARVHLGGIAGLDRVCDVAEDTLSCAEPPETYQVRSWHPGHWFRLHNMVIDHHAQCLGPEALALYACLARYADNTTQQCWPTIARMEQGTGMSRNRVRKALTRLEAYGLITRQERHFAYQGKVWQGYLITLLDPSPLAVRHRQERGGILLPHHGGLNRRRQRVQIEGPRGSKLHLEQDVKNQTQKNQRTVFSFSPRGDKEQAGVHNESTVPSRTSQAQQALQDEAIWRAQFAALPAAQQAWLTQQAQQELIRRGLPTYMHIKPVVESLIWERQQAAIALRMEEDSIERPLYMQAWDGQGRERRPHRARRVVVS